VEWRNKRHEKRAISSYEERSARPYHAGSAASLGQPPVANYVCRANSGERQQDERVELPDRQRTTEKILRGGKE
jgi:hypothetical protein